MFTGYELTEASRNKLLALFPPKYKNVKAHHITFRYGVTKNAAVPEIPKTISVVGYIDSGDGVEGLLVAIDGSTMREGGSKYHITWSLADGKKPVETNNYVNAALPIGSEIPISVTPKNFWN